MTTEPIKITRYPNRRFYTRDESTYISLEDIERLVRSGKRVEIRDNQSDEDLTGLVLTRIIMERQPEKMRLLPVDMLHFMLRANDAMSDFLRDYFRHALPYLEYLQRHGTTAMNLAQKPVHWIKAWLDSIAPADSPPQLTQRKQRKPDPEVLAQRVEELEERIRLLESSGKD